ncbi:aspartate dehydrogenase [Rhodococcus sp. NPDC056960]|uniref:aspartate dehydrogenase n=1 Tax=Rhodococcus sp. NPDC056960 TaxID=3345982 RepID=UPI00363F6659
MTNKTERVAIAGYGAIGRRLVQELRGGIPGLELVAVATRRPVDVKAELVADGIHDVAAVGLDDLHLTADLVIECTSGHLLPQIAVPVLEAGKEVVVVSAGALLQFPELIETARLHGGRLLIPSGALLGLDVVGAAALSDRCEVAIESVKPPRALVGAPFFEGTDIDPAKITERTRIFEGTAREAAGGFPANLNVTAALALAGVGPDTTRAEVWIDPELDTNQHTVTVDSNAVRVSMTINNIPSENPKTGRITALSVISLLWKRHAPLVVGS